MRFKPVLIALCALLGVTAHSQGFNMHFSNSIADCYGAVEVLDYDNESRVQFPGNYGVYDEFEHFSPEFSEVNAVWLRLEPNLEGQFEFEIYD